MSGLSDLDRAKGHMNSSLNKLTVERFVPIVDKLIATLRTFATSVDAWIAVLGEIVSIIFEKAVSERTFSGLYARLCHVLCERLPVVDQETNQLVEPQVFWERVEQIRRQRSAAPSASASAMIRLPGVIDLRKMLVKQCEREFQTLNTGAPVRSSTTNSINNLNSLQQQQQTDEEIALMKKERKMGNIRFIGELFMHQIFSQKIVRLCIDDLFPLSVFPLPTPGSSSTQQNRQLTAAQLQAKEDGLEALCGLLTTVGKRYFAITTGQDPARQKENQELFARLSAVLQDRNISPRIRYKVQDLLDLKQDDWVPRQKQLGPTTLFESRHEDLLARSGTRMRMQLLSSSVAASPGTPASGAMASVTGTGASTSATKKDRYKFAAMLAAATPPPAPSPSASPSPSLTQQSSSTAGNAGLKTSPSSLSSPASLSTPSASASSASSASSSSSGSASSSSQSQQPPVNQSLEGQTEALVAAIRRYATSTTDGASTSKGTPINSNKQQRSGPSSSSSANLDGPDMNVIRSVIQSFPTDLAAKLHVSAVTQAILCLLLDYPNNAVLRMLVPNMVREGLVQVNAVMAGLEAVAEQLDDVLLDAPDLPQQVGVMLAHWVRDGVVMAISMPLFSSTVTPKLRARMLAAFAKELLKGGAPKDKIVQVVREPGFDIYAAVQVPVGNQTALFNTLEQFDAGFLAGIDKKN